MSDGTQKRAVQPPICGIMLTSQIHTSLFTAQGPQRLSFALRPYSQINADQDGQNPTLQQMDNVNVFLLDNGADVKFFLQRSGGFRFSRPFGF